DVLACLGRFDCVRRVLAVFRADRDGVHVASGKQRVEVGHKLHAQALGPLTAPLLVIVPCGHDLHVGTRGKDAGPSHLVPVGKADQPHSHLSHVVSPSLDTNVSITGLRHRPLSGPYGLDATVSWDTTRHNGDPIRSAPIEVKGLMSDLVPLWSFGTPGGRGVPL